MGWRLLFPFTIIDEKPKRKDLNGKARGKSFSNRKGKGYGRTDSNQDKVFEGND